MTSMAKRTLKLWYADDVDVQDEEVVAMIFRCIYLCCPTTLSLYPLLVASSAVVDYRKSTNAGRLAGAHPVVTSMPLP
ncbi:MAG: hypothetical protein VX185_17590 [Pseudomonadota bacterium]|nr:hypothetical protein [Pseudomonadota bacterium]